MVKLPKYQELKDLWSDWEIQGCVIISLMLQVFLILFASCRRRNSRMTKFIKPIVWLAYLLSDAVATFSLGLLSDSMGDSMKFRCRMKSSMLKNDITRHKDLLSFWAPFLILHLGGPDNITAFALEDNELWLRHMLWVVIELSTAGYVFMQSFPSNHLLIPTLLVFVAGTVKYVERTRALYLASSDVFKSSILKTENRRPINLIDEHIANEAAGIPSALEIPDENPTVDSVNVSEEEKFKLTVAHRFFVAFKRIFTDLLLSFNEKNPSHKLLSRCSAEEAFTMMDIELGFTYDILYTKAAVIHDLIGYITRAICFSCILISFFLFFFLFEKQEISEVDIAVTYTLLGGAIAIDAVSLVNLIFSNWTHNPILRAILDFFVKNKNHPMNMSQYNLINACVFERKKEISSFSIVIKILDPLIGISKSPVIKKILDIFIHTSGEMVSKEVKELIFDELKKKADFATDVKNSKRLCSCRGSWALKFRGCYGELGWTTDVEFEESILLWHIATDLCFSHNGDDKNDPKNEKVAISVSIAKRRNASKLISEYLLYLLVQRPSMISSAEGVRQVKFRDALEEAMSVFKSLDINNEEGARGKLFRLCKQISGRMKFALLFNAFFLVKKLNEMDESRKWVIISEVLVELLSYAATNCKGSYHAQALGRGGELLTHVWFLMAHLGLGQQFQVPTSFVKVTADK